MAALTPEELAQEAEREQQKASHSASAGDVVEGGLDAASSGVLDLVAEGAGAVAQGALDIAVGAAGLIGEAIGGLGDLA